MTAQYAVESKQVVDEATIAIRKTQGRLHSGSVLNAKSVQNKAILADMIQNDFAYSFLKHVRGSPAYYQTLLYDILAMIRQLGIPTWFLTLSAADMQWPDVIQNIAKQYGTILTDSDVENMSFEERSKWLRQNPVTAARHFHYRLNTFFQMYLKSNAHPLGEMVDYAIGIEFQARGSPHAHSIVWIKNAPKLNVDADHVVCNFINQYVRCNLPDDEDLSALVCKLQKHKHSKTCRKKGKCRFHYPRVPSPQTLIARQLNNGTCSEQQLNEQSLKVMANIRKTLELKDLSKNITLEELLLKAGVSLDMYMSALQTCSKGNCIVMKRAPSETWINNYNPDVLKIWQANMDIQYVLDPYACVMYIASYMVKGERAMTELLTHVSK